MITEYRRMKHLTQKELATKTGIPLKSLKDYEQGQVKPPPLPYTGYQKCWMFPWKP